VLKAVLEREGGVASVAGEYGRRAGKTSSASRTRRRKHEPASAEPADLPSAFSDSPSFQIRLPGSALIALAELHALGLETSESERRAADAERELMELKKVAFMAGRLGDEFGALIISLTKYGFYVELMDLFVEGLVPLESLEDDRYVYRERLRAVVGERGKRAYRLGDRVNVRLDRIDRLDNKLIFALVE
jgi:ribonuclease R